MSENDAITAEEITRAVRELCRLIKLLPADSEGERLRGIARDFLRDMALESAEFLSGEWRRFFETGDKGFLMVALGTFLACGFELPPWVRRALLDATDCEKKSWDEVFGKPMKRMPKGFVDEVAMAQEEGAKLLVEGYKTYDKHLFAELARRMNEAFGTDISAGTAKIRYYHRPRPLLAFQNPSDVEALDETTLAHAKTILRTKGLIDAISRKLGKKSRKKNS